MHFNVITNQYWLNYWLKEIAEINKLFSSAVLCIVVCLIPFKYTCFFTHRLQCSSTNARTSIYVFICFAPTWTMRKCIPRCVTHTQYRLPIGYSHKTVWALWDGCFSSHIIRWVPILYYSIVRVNRLHNSLSYSITVLLSIPFVSDSCLNNPYYLNKST